jgi:hypothetical protein
MMTDELALLRRRLRARGVELDDDALNEVTQTLERVQHRIQSISAYAWEQAGTGPRSPEGVANPRHPWPTEVGRQSGDSLSTRPSSGAEAP